MMKAVLYVRGEFVVCNQYVLHIQCTLAHFNAISRTLHMWIVCYNGVYMTQKVVGKHSTTH